MANKNSIAVCLALASALLASFPVLAHEYWVEPIDFLPALNQTSAAHLKVGSDLQGQALSYIPQFTVGFQITDSSGTRQMEGKTGDRPALTYAPKSAGLNMITYQTNKSRVTFHDWEKFETYLNTQGMDQIAEQHRRRGLPQTGFAENYSRYAKALLDVDKTGSGQDVATGMTIELVALQNPYALVAGDELSIQLLYLGEPLKNNQISIFSQDQSRKGPVEISRVRTDENGQIAISMQAGQMYLLNAINMVPVEGQAEIVWESFWASMTFETAQ